MSRNAPSRRDGWLQIIAGLLSALGSALLTILVATRLARRPPESEGEDTARTSATTRTTSQAERAPADQDQAGIPPNEAPAVGPTVPPGWHKLDEPLPEPTYWPAVMAVGIVFIAWGIVTLYAISGVGLLLFVIALVGWIGDLRHEQRHP